MAEFLTTHGTAYQIENIIKEAKNKLVLVSPYLQISQNFYARIKDASSRGVTIYIIFGKNELHPGEMASVKELKNVQLYFLHNLHAKIYFNESKMVITSMNMYEFSEKNNREMGVLIDKSNDKEMFDKAVEEVKSFIEASEMLKFSVAELHKKNSNYINTSPAKSTRAENGNSKNGYCIRCETRINLNPEKPYCIDCYNVWVQYENWDYIENVCHKCGKEHDTSMSYPLDQKCYNEIKNAPDPNSIWSMAGRFFSKL